MGNIAGDFFQQQHYDFVKPKYESAETPVTTEALARRET